ARAQFTKFNDGKAAPTTSNPYGSGGDARLGPLSKRGMHLAVCQMATRFFAEGIAGKTGSTGDAVYAELAATLIGQAHLVAAGIVAVNRAQERGFALAIG